MTLRVILDTNIYGRIIEEGVEDRIIERLDILKHDIAIYGMKEIRKELRAAPKHSKDIHQLKILLLQFYDSVTKGHLVDTKPLAENIAQLYYRYYRKNKGSLSWNELKTDMIIVAQATLSKLDIVVSEDNRSMLSDAAKKAYFSVNKEHNLITPNFIRYEEFKNKLI